ncbi:hypothetical protein [Dehalobacterium formicoaceticum]|uniref:hypothetical protein n=1 Tax=Dehalobacterium formicoaceticum TaxID=51515 RepID=UPI000B7FE74E|nr:hypothetical protein [Dehalobacterium formicoaceticum]
MGNQEKRPELSTMEMRKKYEAKGAKFYSDLKEMKFTPGDQVQVKEKVSEKKWSEVRQGKIVGDYPSFVQVNYGTSWSDVCYLKQDILIGRVCLGQWTEKYEDLIS